MWGLYKEDGTPFREGFPSQWEAVRTAQKEDGSSFKKQRRWPSNLAQRYFDSSMNRSS